MKEKINNIIHTTIQEAADEFGTRYDPKKNVEHKKRGPESQRDLDQIRDRIVKFISSTIDTIDWENDQAVTEFCARIDSFVSTQVKKFQNAFARTGSKESPVRKWVDFVRWQKELRYKTKQQIKDEILRYKMIEMPSNTSKMTIEKRDLEESAPLKKEKKRGIDLPPDVLDAPATQATRSESATTELEATQTNDTEQELPPSALELPNEFDLPNNVMTALALYTSAIQSGNTEKSAAYLHELSKLVGKIDQDRREAEELWEDEGAARVELEARNEMLIATGEENTNLKNDIAKKEELLEQARKLETELRYQISNAVAIAPLETPIKQPEENTTFDLTTTRIAFEKGEKALKEKIDFFEERSLELARWINEANEFVNHELNRRRATANDANLNNVNRLAEQLHKNISKKTEEMAMIEDVLHTTQATHDEIVQKLTALRVTHKIITSNELGDLADTKTTIPPTHELPELSDWLQETEQNMSVAPPAPALEKNVSTTIDGLPFTVEFADADLTRVRELEKLLLSYKDKTESEILNNLPAKPADEIKAKYFDELKLALQTGDFLPRLKLVIVVLGAMRDNNSFQPKMAKLVGEAMFRKNVKIVQDLRESGKLIRAFLQSDMLATVNNNLRLITRGRIFKWGPLNILTELGEKASQVWSKDLLEANEITKNQLINIYENEQKKIEDK